MRIVGGNFRGRPIAAPRHEGVRPTSDRVREAVFNILAHAIADFDIAGIRVVDLFAGTGAMGLEALSRGAGFCLFVDDDAESRALIRRNIEAFGLTGCTRIFRRDATDLGDAGRGAAYHLAFLDPPYGQGLAEKALASLAAGSWLSSGAIVVVEERASVALALPPPYAMIDHRSYGDTQALFLRYQTIASP